MALDSCLALSLEAGGSHGAFEAGAIKAMIELLDPNEVQWDVVGGVSIGSINASMIACH